MTPTSVTTWTWQFLDAERAVLADPRSETFTSRADAESWIGENWPAMREAGVVRVQLIGGGAPVGRTIALEG